VTGVHPAVLWCSIGAVRLGVRVLVGADRCEHQDRHRDGDERAYRDGGSVGSSAGFVPGVPSVLERGHGWGCFWMAGVLVSSPALGGY
jgi:hypothetical protein